MYVQKNNNSYSGSKDKYWFFYYYFLNNVCSNYEGLSGPSFSATNESENYKLQKL